MNASESKTLIVLFARPSRYLKRYLKGMGGEYVDSTEIVQRPISFDGYDHIIVVKDRSLDPTYFKFQSLYSRFADRMTSILDLQYFQGGTLMPSTYSYEWVLTGIREHKEVHERLCPAPTMKLAWSDKWEKRLVDNLMHDMRPMEFELTHIQDLAIHPGDNVVISSYSGNKSPYPLTFAFALLCYIFIFLPTIYLSTPESNIIGAILLPPILATVIAMIIGLNTRIFIDPYFPKASVEHEGLVPIKWKPLTNVVLIIILIASAIGILASLSGTI